MVVPTVGLRGLAHKAMEVPWMPFVYGPNAMAGWEEYREIMVPFMLDGSDLRDTATNAMLQIEMMEVE